MSDRVKLTPEQIAEQLRDGERIAPGFWIDRAGDLHVSVPELLAHFNLPDTPTNRERMTTFVREQMEQLAPQVTIVEQE